MSRQFWKRKVLLAAVETTYGVKPTVGAAQAITAIDVSIDPMMGQNLDRNIDFLWLTSQETIPAEVHAKLKFKVELAAAGTLGTVPFWGPLLRACGFAQTVAAGVSVTYNPVSSGFESVSMDFWIDAVRYQLNGARGNAVFRVEMGIPYIEFEFWGLFNRPDAAAVITPTMGGTRPLAAQSVNTPTFTINSVALGARSFVLNAGVSVIPRFTMGVAPEILITGREAEALDMTVEARTLATFDPYGLAEAGTLVPIALTHGVAAGRRIKFAAPAAQLLLIGAPTNSDGIVVNPLSARLRPTSGNDQFTVVLD
jgi:hypothetical protein